MPSLTDILNALKLVVVIADDLKRQDAEVKEMRRELRDLTIIVHALAQDIKNSKEQAAQKYENLLLEIENRLLRSEKALRPAEAAKREGKSVEKKGGKK
jgi:hypothetical protein